MKVLINIILVLFKSILNSHNLNKNPPPFAPRCLASFSILIAEVLGGCPSSDREAAERPLSSSSAGLRDTKNTNPKDGAEDPEEEAPGPAGGLRSVHCGCTHPSAWMIGHSFSAVKSRGLGFNARLLIFAS